MFQDTVFSTKRLISRFSYTRQASRSFDFGELNREQCEDDIECSGSGRRSKCRVDGAVEWRSSLRRRLQQQRAKSSGQVVGGSRVGSRGTVMRQHEVGQVLVTFSRAMCI